MKEDTVLCMILTDGSINSYKATNIKTEEVVAVKVTPYSELLNIYQELALQKTCHHSNIMRVGDCFEWKDKLWIIMEYMEKGSLFGIVGKEIHFEEQYIAYVCKGILSALRSMHRDNRIHRGMRKDIQSSIDIKSDNILINGQGEVKLADFGFAVRLKSNVAIWSEFDL